MTRPTAQAQLDSLEEALQRYMAYLQLERGASPRTLSGYQGDLMGFVASLRNSGVHAWTDLQLGHITAYLSGLTATGIAPASAARKITSLRTFLRYLHGQATLALDYSQRISAPKIRRKLPQTLSLASYETLLRAIPTHTPIGLRDLAMIEMLFGCGLRVSELTTLRLVSVDIQQGSLRLWGKGSKERIVPLGRAAQRTLVHYLQVGRPSLLQPTPTKATELKQKPTDAVFVTHRGTAISRQMVWVALRGYAARAGLGHIGLKPHLLRHSYATHLLKGGADLRMIQELLGHSSIATTQIYTAVEPTHLLETHALHHPRKNMKS